MTGRQVIPDAERTDVGSGDSLIMLEGLIHSGACDPYLYRILTACRERMHTSEWAAGRVIAGGT